MKKMKKVLLHLFLPIFPLFLRPDAALALQIHPAPEGLYAHNIAHAFFIFSMATLAFWLQKRRLVVEKGWRYIQISCLLFIFWNIDAMAGHIIDSYLSEEAFTGQGWAKSMIKEKVFAPYFYYLLKMDHLICVPAIFFLFLGLKRLKVDAGVRET